MGGGERGMSRPSGRCICSAAASAVNSHGWTHRYRHTQWTHLHTQLLVCLLRGSSMNNVFLLLSVTVSLVSIPA